MEGINQKINNLNEGYWEEIIYENNSVKVLETGNYINGKREGVWFKRDMYTILEITNYRNGKQHGIKMELISNNNSIVETGSIPIYFSVKTCIRIYNYKENILDGKYIKINEDNIVYDTGEYLNGYQNGYWKETIGNTYTKTLYSNGDIINKISHRTDVSNNFSHVVYSKIFRYPNQRLITIHKEEYE